MEEDGKYNNMNILFSLLTVFLIIITAVGLYFNWNSTVMSVFLGMTLVCSGCKLFCNCKRLVLSTLKKCKDKVQKTYRKNIRRLSVNFGRKINRWKLENTSEKQISLLSPVDDFERHKEYIIRLKNAIDRPNVFNIALTGSYGAGKSSILKTFKTHYPEYHFVNVSLASFVEARQPKCSDKENCKEEEGFEEQLEYSILQQLFYHVKAKSIPESRFGRIERTSCRQRILLVLGILLFIVASLFLFCRDQVTTLFLIPAAFLKSSSVFWISISVFLVGIYLILYKFILCIKKISIKNLKLDKATIELEEKKNVSIMNRYLDEIIYLFQEKKYDVVIFEDIDRFENTHIFTKLRELNLILNQSEEIGRRIVFLYALKDDIFANAEERTKFFDYIVPVIPFVNVSNSGDLFRRKIAELNIPETEVRSSFITDISAFVNDMRVLTNVVNEFDLYRHLLDPKLNKEKLLAMVLYKNLYPTDFSLLHQNKGVVYETFISAGKLKDEIEKDDMARLKEIDLEIHAINEELLKSIEELQAVIVGKFMKLWPGGNSYLFCDGSRKSINDLYSDKNILKLLNGEVGFYIDYYNTHYFSKDEIKRVLGNSYNYNNRKTLILSAENDKIEYLKEERKTFMEELSIIEKYSILDIAKSDRNIFEHVEKVKGQEEKYKVLKYLLEKGYIDEKYFFYISIFQEGRLTPSDQEFLLSIKFNTPKGFDYKLQEVPSLIQNLSVVDFDNKGVLNKDLLEYCLEHEDEYEDKCDAIIKQMVVHEQYVDLLYKFMQEGTCLTTFIKRLAHIDKNIWKSLDKDINHADKEKDSVISMIFMSADINDIKEINSAYSFNSYINKNSSYPHLFEDIDKDKVQKLLELLNLQVQSLKDDSNTTDTYSYIYENDMYAITFNNIKVIFEHNGLSTNDLNSAICTSIGKTELSELQTYIHQQLPTFVDNLMFSPNNTQESSDIIASLMDEDIGVSDIIKLIKHNDTLWDDCKGINDEDVICTLFVENKIKMTFENVNHYCSCFDSWEMDNTLATFMNRNEVKSIEEFTKLVESEDEHQKELLQSVVLADNINDNIAYSIFNNRSLIDVWNKNLSQINEKRIKYIVDNGIISKSPSSYHDIIKEHPQLSKYLLCKTPDDIIAEWDDFGLGINTVINVLSWSEYKDYQNFVLNKIDTNNITPAVADSLLSYFSKPENEFNLALYIEAMEKSNNPILKVSASTCCITKRMIALNELSNIFAKTKGVFEGLEKQGEVYSISKQIEGAQHFMDALHQFKYIGKVKEKGDYFTGQVLKRKQK